MTTIVLRRLSVIAALTLAIALPGFAQTAAGTPSFVGKLLTQLEQDGWSPAASQALANAAARLNWNGTNGADPQAVAFALQYSATHGAALPATVRAQLALRLALGSVEMQQAGMDRQSIAVAALSAVRASLADLQAGNANQTAGNGVGNVIGKAVSNAVRNQIQASVRSQMRSHASVGRGQGSNEGNGPYGPPSGTPGGSPASPGGAHGPKVR